MQQFITWVDSLSWAVVIAFCLTLGLAPFTPPHIAEKLQMLVKGKLVKPVDWIDLLFHGAPWAILIIKTVINARR